MTKKHLCLFLCTFLCFGLLSAGCGLQSRPEMISKSGFYFNTVITVTLYDPSQEQLLEECFSLADRYEGYFSNTIKDSDVSKINGAAGCPVAVHEETLELIEKGIYYGRLSGGKFDITIGRLSDLWDFSAKALLDETDASMLPSAQEIAAAVATVNYENIRVEGDTAALTDPDARLDLGGIAKGYIADKMKLFLYENGVESGTINLGGNVLTLGPKNNGSAYRIGIQKPFAKDAASIAAVEVTDQTVVSSGIYERYFKVGGRLYHHILDTKTGYPYDNGLLGVTIITKDSVDGDGLSTTCFALGLEKGMELIEGLDDTEAIFITEDYKLHKSSGIGKEVPFRMVE